VHILSRTDDVINVAGHRISTGHIEEVIASNKNVAECAVIGPEDPIKGQIPVAFVVVKSTTHSTTGIDIEIIKAVRDKIGPVVAFKTVHFVKKLPKTRSGKIVRATMKKIADGVHFKMPATIEDPTALHDIEAIYKK